MLWAEAKLRRRRSAADLLPWAAAVAPGVVATKDGKLSAAFSFQPRDLESSTVEELVATARAINRALRVLGEGTHLHIDAVRSPTRAYAAEGAFPDPLTRLLDRERREAFEAGSAHFVTRHVLSVSWAVPSERAAGWARRLLLSGPARRGRTIDWRRMLARFEARLGKLSGALSGALAPRRLGTEAMLSHFHAQLTGRHHPIRLPAVPMYLDGILGAADLYGGLRPVVGRRHLRVVSIDGFPLASEPAITDFLSHLPIPYRWSTRWIPLSRARAERVIARARRNHLKGRHGLLRGLRAEEARSAHAREDLERYSDPAALALWRDAQEAYAEASSGVVAYGYLSSVVVLMDRDEGGLEEAAERVEKAVARQGFTARIEEANALEALMGSFAGNDVSNVRRPLLHTLNLAHLMPMTALYSGEPACPSPQLPAGSPPLLFARTSGSTPYRANLHVGDVGHALVVGTTGTGKSVLLGQLAASWLRYPRAQVFCFDKGYSALALCLGAGGRHYDLLREAAGEGGASFAPLARVDREAERVWAAGWLQGLFEGAGLRLGAARLEALRAALSDLALYGPGERTLTVLSTLVQDHELRGHLRPYTLAGDFGLLLDAADDPLSEAPFQVFELEALIAAGARVAAPTLAYLFHEVERRLDGRPTLISVDEAWAALAHGPFRRQIRDWLKTARKKNAAVVLATQSLADLELGGEAWRIHESTPTKIFLPNPEARSPAGREAYQRLGLNPRQIELIARMEPRREYYWTSPEGRRKIDLALGPLALSFLSAADPESLARVRALHGEHGAGWPEPWLRARGLGRWADRFRKESLR